MANNARDQVQAILAETGRRKRVWAEMQRVAREALVAVTAEARRRGVRGQNWMGGDYDHDYAFISFPTYGTRLDELIEAKRPRREKHTFQLHGSGTLERPEKGGTYEGYPDLVEDDPFHFRAAAVAELMGSLNTYIRKHGRRGQGKRR